MSSILQVPNVLGELCASIHKLHVYFVCSLIYWTHRSGCEALKHLPYLWLEFEGALQGRFEDFRATSHMSQEP